MWVGDSAVQGSAAHGLVVSTRLGAVDVVEAALGEGGAGVGLGCRGAVTPALRLHVRQHTGNPLGAGATSGAQGDNAAQHASLGLVNDAGGGGGAGAAGAVRRGKIAAARTQLVEPRGSGDGVAALKVCHAKAVDIQRHDLTNGGGGSKRALTTTRRQLGVGGRRCWFGLCSCAVSIVCRVDVTRSNRSLRWWRRGGAGTKTDT